jgi:hypothetical protein
MEGNFLQPSFRIGFYQKCSRWSLTSFICTGLQTP